MHFQVPPFDHEKLVYVTEGRVVDVVLDLRLSSSTFGHHLAFTLEAFGPSLLIPRGCAHGFMVLSENATIVYNVSTEYHQTADKGILWNSFGFNWGIDKPILSERDQAFPSFGDQSYFE
jgi:dTDP-4-dehydrorhamnose 3,5-epimerase